MSENKTALSLKNDFVFKYVYGSDTDESNYVLKCLLNKILNREDDPIQNLEIRNPFQLKHYVDDKETVLDIRAETDKGELIDIEMQVVWDKHMVERLIYYHGGLIRDSLQSGEHYSKMKPTITICITDDIVFDDEEDYMSEFYFMERDRGFVLSKKTKICCIELPKVNPEKKPMDELTPLEVCLEYLRYADESNSEYANELVRSGGKELEVVQKMLTKVTEEEKLREYARAREKYQRDKIFWEHRYEDGVDDGYEQGQKDGFTQGLRKGNCIYLIEQIKKKLEKGKLLEQIVDELEDDRNRIQHIYELVRAHPEHTSEQIFEMLFEA